MAAKEKEVQIFIYSLLLFAIFLMGYFIIYPELISIKKIQNQFLGYKKALQQKEETLQEFNKVAASYKTKLSNAKKLDSMILNSSDKVFLLVQLDNLASRNALTMESISFGELVASEKSVGILPVTLSVKGTYRNFKNYLADIAKNATLMEVKTLNFQVGSSSDSLYSFALTLDVFTKDSPQTAETAKETEEGSNEESSVDSQTK
jgi:Tfp pilus assembly protein PilO